MSRSECNGFLSPLASALQFSNSLSLLNYLASSSLSTAQNLLPSQKIAILTTKKHSKFFLPFDIKIFNSMKLPYIFLIFITTSITLFFYPFFSPSLFTSFNNVEYKNWQLFLFSNLETNSTNLFVCPLSMDFIV